jgi:hypothetical protein
MASVSTMLVPPLLKGARLIEDMFNKYGGTIYLDPKDDSSNGAKPSKVMNIDFLNNLGKAILEYQDKKAEFKKQKEDAKSSAIMYYVGFIVLWVIVVCVLIWICRSEIKMNWAFWMDDKWILSIKLCYLTIAIVLLIFVFTLAGLVLQKNLKINDKTYNMVPVEMNEVKKMVDMMHSVDKSSGGIIRHVETTHPLMMYYMGNGNATAQGMKIKYYGPRVLSEEDRRKCECAVKDIQETDFLEKCLPDKHKPGGKPLVYPFISDNDETFDGQREIHFFKLKEQLQSMDLYGQFNRISRASDFFRNFLLKENDEKYANTGAGINNSVKEQIRANIVKILSADFAEINDLRMDPKALSAVAALNRTQCYQSCLNDETCFASKFDENAKMCHQVKSKPINMEYDASNKERWLIKSSDEIAKVKGNTLNEDFVDMTFSEDVVCDQESIKCLINGKTKNMGARADNDAASYAEVFAGTLPGDHVMFTDTLANIVKANTGRAEYVTLLRDMKEYFVEAIVASILTADDTKTFVLEEQDIEIILNNVVTNLGQSGAQYASAITDILGAVPDKLLKAATAHGTTSATGGMSQEALKRFVPYERFKEKLGELNSRDFIVDFVFNAEEMRATSDGLYDMYNNYNVSNVVADYNNRIKTVTISFVAVLGALILCVSLLTSFYNHKQNEEYNNIVQSIAKNKEEITKKYNSIKEKKDGANNDNDKSTFDDVDEAKKDKKLKKELESLHKAGSVLKNRKWGYWFSFGISIVLPVSIFIILYILVLSHQEKKKAVHVYNTSIMQKNADTVKQNAYSVINVLYSDLVESNNYGIQRQNPDTSYKTNKSLIIANISIDPTANKGDMHASQIFDTIVKSSTVDGNVNLTFKQDVHTYELYLKLVSMLDAYEKCNGLFVLGDANVPLPLTELLVYGTMFIVTLLVVAYVIAKYEPFKHFANIRYWIKLSDRLQKGMPVPDNDMDEPMDMTEPAHVSTMMAFKFIMLIFGIIFVILFCKEMMDSSTNFKNSLYSDPRFANSECYT